jgi:hypothetical protein
VTVVKIAECGHRIPVLPVKVSTWCPACNDLVLLREDN